MPVSIRTDTQRLVDRQIREAMPSEASAPSQSQFAQRYGSGASLKPRWTEADIAVLADLYGIASPTELSMRFGRSYDTIRAKAQRMKIRANRK